MTTKIFMNTFRITTLCCILLAQNVYAQSEDFLDDLLQSGVKDAETYLGNYLKPGFVAFGYGMANGWNATAKTHKTLGFDFNVSFNLARVPSGNDYFTFVESQYSNLKLSNPAENKMKTVFGPDKDGPDLIAYNEKTGASTTIKAPGGVGFLNGLPTKTSLPAPTVQLGVGVWQSTDIILRFIPNMTFGDYQVGAFGLGIKHNIKQWIPVLKRVPIDISGLVAYSNYDNSYNIGNDDNIKIAGENQIGYFDVNNWNFQLLGGKKFSVLTAYASLGYVSTVTKMKIDGTYILGNGTTLKDPISMKFKTGSVMASAGLRVKLGVFYFYGQYTLQEYNVISFGMGAAFRED